LSVPAKDNSGAAAALVALRGKANAEDAVFLQRFFKTAPGQYGAGDRFLGIRVPVLRQLAREHAELTLEQSIELLHSPYHEARMLALLILASSFARSDERARAQIYDAYLANAKFVNNWDLVDLSAPGIVGGYLADRDRSDLTRLARSDSLWERRIAIVATYHFIRANDFDDTLRVASLLLKDKHDLIHKAVGWMLREAGKRDEAAAEAFLLQHYQEMPRTMLRYAIERFPEKRRQAYLRGEL
jgi:3-methyladenine DNA glycosylase AlkD